MPDQSALHRAYVFVYWAVQARMSRGRRLWAITSGRLRAKASSAVVTFAIDRSVAFEGRCRFEILPHTSSRITIGPRTRIGHEVQFNLRGGTVDIGADVDVRRLTAFNVEGALRIDDRVVLSNGTFVHCASAVTIGEATAIGEYSTIADSNHVRTPPGVPVQQEIDAAPVVLGRNIWVGARAAITAGVVVGDQAFVGAHAVVTRDVDPATLVAGVPARPVRRLTTRP